jgi:hypothetical protein
MDIRRFSNKYGVELVQCEDYFTFKILAELPNYSFAGHPYGGLVATVYYAGKREEVIALKSEIESLSKRTKALIDEWALEECPIKVGDITPIGGYSHSGKSGKVTAVLGKWDQWSKEPRFYICATVFKKDGTEGAFRTAWEVKP